MAKSNGNARDLIKQGGVSMVEPFDLAAYDDLLLLLAIAQTTPASARGAPPPRQRTTPAAAPRDETLALQQQQPQPEREGHAGRGSQSALEQLRLWEERRAVQSGGKRREGPP